MPETTQPYKHTHPLERTSAPPPLSSPNAILIRILGHKHTTQILIPLQHPHPLHATVFQELDPTHFVSRRYDSLTPQHGLVLNVAITGDVDYVHASP